MSMLVFIILPMLIAAATIAMLGEKLIKSYLIAIAGAAASLGFSLYFLATIFGRSITQSYVWMQFSFGRISVSLTGNNLTLSAAVLVSFVSLVILIFSVFYMDKEPQKRYYVEMSIFIMSMLGLVISGSLLLFYVFWELVGVSSYLLIGFWYKKESAAAAGNKALIITRIGDMAFLAAIIILFSVFGTFSINSILSSTSVLPSYLVFISASLILIAGLSKSAQFPFYTWLPDAMEGPTPVSALLHSATMVAAGAYLLVRLYPLIGAANIGSVIVTLALISALIAILLGIYETHIKRIIAYSTIESLSFMFMAIGTANIGGAIFYLFTHAIFKSLLFLVAGAMAIFFETYDIYDLKNKKLGGTWLEIPAVIGFASLAGLPPFMSFFAHAAFSYGFSMLEETIFIAISFFTALYSFRAFFVMFSRRSQKNLRKSFPAYFSIYILSIISIIGGSLLFTFSSIINIHYSFNVFVFIDVVSAFVGVYFGYAFFYKSEMAGLRYAMRNAADRFNRYKYDRLVYSIGRAFVRLGVAAARFDDGLSSFYSALASGSIFLSSSSKKIQNGDAHTYMIAIFIGLLALISIAAVLV
ncbi:hypothetical protein M1293_03395 [Candidatus Parvarchaeota archaeon]|nr:hypothetical protein [Candidatus Parvarchaeota archaeon]